MAVVAHFGTGDSTTAVHANNTGSALTIAKPANVAVGDLLIGHFYSQFNGATTTDPAGWTLAHKYGVRGGGMYYLAVTDATVLASLPSTWQLIISSGSGRLTWSVHRVTGADLTSPIDVIGTEASQNAVATFTLPSCSPTNANGLLESWAYWNNSSTTQSTYTPDPAMTDGEQVKSPATGNTSGIDIAYQTLTSSGATGTRTVTTSPTGASNGGFLYVIKAASGPVLANAAFAGSGAFTASVVQSYAVSVGFTGAGLFSAAAGTNVTSNFSGSGSFSAAVKPSYNLNANFSGTGSFTTTGKTPAQIWASTIPLYAAHRGGSADWPQSTMYAYDHAVAWNKDMALEVSVWPSTNGTWWVNHDDTLASTGQWNSSAQITTSTDATLSSVATTVGGYPLLKLSDLLAKYGGKRVIIIDNKGSLNTSSLISLLDANGGSGWYVSKSYYTAVGWPAAMRTAGYLTLGYYYDADTAQIASTQSKFDVLMEDYTATSTSWSTILAYPQPVMAHIVPDATAKATAISKGAEGFMASGVVEVVPPTGSAADFTGSGIFSAVVKQSYTINANFTGSGLFSDSVVQNYNVTAGFSGSGVFSATGREQYAVNALFSGAGVFTDVAQQNYIVAVPFNGSGVFTVSVVQAGVTNVPFSGAGVFTASVKQQYITTAHFTGGGTFTAVVQSGPTGYSVSIWDGNILIPVTIVGMWDGTSVVPVQVIGVVSA